MRPPAPLLLLDRLAVEREIEALTLDLFRHPQADHNVKDLEDDQRHDRAINKHNGDADALIDELHGVAFKHAGCATILFNREHAREQCPHDATDPMHPEGIERIIVAEDMLEA